MSGISADADPSKIRSTGREKKCGTCRNMYVKPPEVELAKYALPIGACAPGVKCLGGAVRGMCQALGVVVESTSLVPNVPCGGRSYVPGGPSIHGTEGMDEQTRAAVMGLSGSMSRTGSADRASGGGVGGMVDDGAAAIALAFVGVLAGPALKWVSDRVGVTGSAARGDYEGWHVGDPAMWHGKKVLVVDVHGYGERQTADLRWTIGYDTSNRSNDGHWSNHPGPQDEVSGHKRNVPVAELEKPAGSAARGDYEWNSTRTTQSDEPTDWEDRPPRGAELKPGRYLLDPHNRVVTVERVLPDGVVRVRLAGPHGTGLNLPVSAMRPPWVDRSGE